MSSNPTATHRTGSRCLGVPSLGSPRFGHICLEHQRCKESQPAFSKRVQSNWETTIFNYYLLLFPLNHVTVTFSSNCGWWMRNCTVARKQNPRPCVCVCVFFSLWVQLFSWLNLYLLWPLSLSCDQMAKGQISLKPIKHNVMSVDAFLRDTLGWKRRCLLHKSNWIFFSLWVAFQRLEVCVTADVREWDEAQKAGSAALTSFQPAAFWIDTGHKGG